VLENATLQICSGAQQNAHPLVGWAFPSPVLLGDVGRISFDGIAAEKTLYSNHISSGHLSQGKKRTILSFRKAIWMSALATGPISTGACELEQNRLFPLWISV
jgi:hypothetical protein